MFTKDDWSEYVVDMRGTPIRVGTHVAVATMSYRSAHLRIGVVDGFTPQTIRIRKDESSVGKYEGPTTNIPVHKSSRWEPGTPCKQPNMLVVPDVY